MMTTALRRDTLVRGEGIVAMYAELTSGEHRKRRLRVPVDLD